MSKQENLNFLYCIDENYNFQCYISICSLLKYSNNEITVHIIHQNPDSFNEYFEKLNIRNVEINLYHFEEKDYSVSNINEFYKRDKYVDSYHVISPKVMKELQKFTSKPITYIPFWVNQNIWFEIKDKKKIRTKHNIPADSYVIGSFQRDTEGKDLKSPKLIKGPDRLVEIAKYYKTLNTDLIVLLSGKRRQYIMAELKKETAAVKTDIKPLDH